MDECWEPGPLITSGPQNQPQMHLGGFGESHGYVRTATEVPSDNPALMRNTLGYENTLRDPVTAIARAITGVLRGFGKAIPRRGYMREQNDISVFQDMRRHMVRSGYPRAKCHSFHMNSRLDAACQA